MAQTETAPASGPAGALPKIAVIGAGFGGLACAFELSEAGYAVDVFEARNRIGGRVHTVQDFGPNQHVEFGAELIGKNHLHWQRYAKRFGIEFDEFHDDGPPPAVLFDDKIYTGDEAHELEKEMDAGFAELTREAEQVDADQPWLTPDAARLDQLSMAERLKTLNLTERARRAIGLEFVLDMAVSLEQMSYLAILTTIKGHGLGKFWTDTEVYRAKSGNQILASYLAAGITNGKLHLDCPVTRITQSGKQLELTLRDGRKQLADDVVLAVPPSVWNRIEIQPPLPAELRPQMGTASKFITICEKDFWSPDRSSDAMTDTLAGSIWEGPVAEGNPHRALVSFVGGPISQKLHEMAIPERSQAIQNAIEKVHPGYLKSHLKSDFVDWPGNIWTRGGYSFPAPGQFLTQSKIFKTGLGHLHFAGEHTSCGFIGYMEGALETGANLARRLIQRDLPQK